jgi:hypothetical protein
MSPKQVEEYTRRCGLESEHVARVKLEHIDHHLFEKQEHLLLVVRVAFQDVRHRTVARTENTKYSVYRILIVVGVARHLGDRDGHRVEAVAVVPAYNGC